MSKHDWPVRLADKEDSAAKALRRYAEASAKTGDEAAAHARLMSKLGRLSRRRWLLPAAVGAAAVPVLAWLLHVGRGHESTGPGAVAKSPAAVTTIVPPRQSRMRLADVATPLPKGMVDLPTGVTAVLSDGAAATARLQEGTLDIALASGTIQLGIAPREIGQAVLVTADRFHFTVVGTAFSLTRGPRRLDLTVTEGMVAVSREADHLATVVAGENWSSDLVAPGPVARTRRAAPAKRSAPADCTGFSVEQGPERMACYRELAKKGGPEGERAQHALARYLRDDVVDLTAALSAFEAQRARFPHGELKVDADRAIIGLLPQLGRHAEALVETQSFLDAEPDVDDRAEIRMLRGDIYRAIFRDLTSAEREYDEGSEARGRTGDDSRFLHALCLESLGRTDEARAAYQAYLAQDGSAHAREAQRRMEKLSR